MNQIFSLILIQKVVPHSIFITCTTGFREMAGALKKVMSESYFVTAEFFGMAVQITAPHPGAP